ncbi:MAG: hypothetical protein J6T84_10810 [Spirochaetaceae bacterium]|nr:hypothetical protein [Spirochaetaceae bacterium]
MVNNAAKEIKEKEILEIFSRINTMQNKESLEYKKALQRIYLPIWDWALICFKEEDVRKAGVEVFHCIKRTIKNYEDKSDSSYIGYLYSCLDFEIRRRNEKAEVKKFRMCTKNEYNRAVKLVKEAERIGKNPSNEKVQIWLAKQSKMSIEEVKGLIFKYYQSQIIENQIKQNAAGEAVSIFETEAVHNNYLTPEQDVFKTEYVLEDLAIIEQVFDKCQERQKEYLSSFITLKILQILERSFLIAQIVELLQGRTFLDVDLLKIFLSHETMPKQAELAAKYKKDEGYISNRISEFFEKVQKKISS